MADPRFYKKAPALSVSALAKQLGAEVMRGAADNLISDVASLALCRAGDVSFLSNAKFTKQLSVAQASAVIVAPDSAALVPIGAAVLVAQDPYKTYALAAQYFYPAATNMLPILGVQAQAVDSSAKIESDVEIGIGAIIGAHAEIGAGTKISAYAIIGQGCVIGRDCVIGAHSVLQYTLLGDRVLVHPDVSLGQDGFGFAPHKSGHVKIPQLGRVIVQNDVEIGAGTKIDRGTLADTSIGAGTKIDNCVHIAHNVEIGRHCLIAGQVGFAGSTKLGDFVTIGGSTVISGHLTIGDGCTVVGASGLTKSIPAGSVFAGFPAKPMTQWRKEAAILARLVKNKSNK